MVFFSKGDRLSHIAPCKRRHVPTQRWSTNCELTYFVFQVRNEDNYKRNAIKKAKVKGKAHTNYKGRIVPQKEPKQELCRCRMQCTLSMDDKKEIHYHFYKIETKEHQDLYLQGLIELKQCTSHRPRTENAKFLDHVFQYHCLNGNERIHICKTAFLTDCLVKGDIPIEKRGKHENRGNALPASELQLINSHINSFPVKTSHLYI